MAKDSDKQKPRDEKADRDLILELNFVPTWARQQPGENPYSKMDYGGGRKSRGGGRDQRGGGRGGDRGGRGGPQDRNRGQRQDRGRPGGDARRGGGGAAERGGERSWQGRGDRRHDADRDSELHGDLWIDISFVPDPDSLGQLVRKLRGSMRAYPLSQISELFLLRPARYMIKVEARSKENRKESKALFQCTESKLLFLDRDACVDHLVKDELERHFEKKEVECDPPKGNFVCVARCGLSKTWLGPPNYHGYNDAIQKVWQSRYSNMTLEAYRSKVQTLHDEESLEAWKDSIKTKVVYILKNGTEEPKEEKPEVAKAEEPAVAAEEPPAEAPSEEAEAETPDDAAAETVAEEAPAEDEAAPEPEPTPEPEPSASDSEDAPKELSLNEAKAYFAEHIANAQIRKLSRAVVPTQAAKRLSDQTLSRRIGDAWTWENKNYRTLHRALRPALRNMGFYLFKTKGGETFVSPIHPRPIDPASSVTLLKEELEYLTEHPGTTREQLVKALRPDDGPESEKVAELIKSLIWMIERGHVIEFFDGALALPTAMAAGTRSGG